MSEDVQKPLYVRVQEYLADLILSAKLLPESKIQSERELSEDLGVSRMTVRRAITELVHEGLLERRHGSGTFVAKPKITYEAYEMIDYIQAMQQRNLAVGSQLIEFSEMVASRRLADILQIEIGDPLYRVVILRFANRVPVILERGFFPHAFCAGLDEWNLEKSSIYDLLTTVYRIKLGHISQTVEAVSATDVIAQQFRVEEGYPLLMLSRIIYSADIGKPVVYSQDFLRSDYVRIQNEVPVSTLVDEVMKNDSREEVPV